MTRRITKRVYEADGTTFVRTLTRDFDRQWLDDRDDVGSGRVTVPVGSSDEDELTDGRIVKCRVDGTDRFAWLVEQADKTSAGPGRQSDRVTTVSGRGLLALLERAVVYPELALGLRSPQTRFFNYASADFDDSGWSAAVELKQQSDSATPWSGAPAGWQDPNAWWIGITGDATPGVGPGERYFRTTFTIASGDEGDYIAGIACDDTWQLYIDGDLIAQEVEVGAWMEARTVELPLDVGTHTIAVACSNLDRTASPSTNVFGFIFSLAPLEFGATPIVSSDSTWKVDDGGAGVPGMFVGQILDILLTEAQARGCFPEITWDFTALLDSNANSWPSTLDVSFPVQTSYLDVIRHFIDEHAAQIWMTPDLVLHAAPRRGTDLSGSVSIEYGENVSRLKHTRVGPGANTTLALSVFGRWFEATDSAAVTAWGRREVGLSLGSAPSLAAVVRQTDAFFADHAQPVEALTDVQVEEVSGAVVYSDWDVGDTVSAPGFDGSATDYVVVALAMSEDEAGNPNPQPELQPA